MENSERIIADTSVWIEFLKNNNKISETMGGLLEKNCICGAGCIFGELLAGIRSQKEGKIILEYWNCLSKLDESDIWVEAGFYLNEKKLLDRGLGLIDSAIIVLAIKNNCKVWSLAEKFRSTVDSHLLYNDL